MDSGNIISYIFKSLLFLLVFGSILFLAYITTRLLAAKVNNTMKGRYMSIIETISLGIDKKLYLVKVSNMFILLSSSGKNLEFITVVPVENYEESTEDHWSYNTAKTTSSPNIVNISAIADIINRNIMRSKSDIKSSINFKSNLNKVKKSISSIVGNKAKNNKDMEDSNVEGKTNEEKK
ncbi:MAG TPA: FliO/MopB family protein [Clostridiaceae bacterium]|nr:FliO/MopB family protein [Clostridiaceae bacterium]